MPNINLTGTPKLNMVGSVAHIVPESGGDTWDFSLLIKEGITIWGFGEVLLENIPNEVLNVINSPTVWKWTGTATVGGHPTTAVLRKFGEEWRIRVVRPSALYPVPVSAPAVVTATYEPIIPAPGPEPDPYNPEPEPQPEPEPEPEPNSFEPEPTPEEKKEDMRKAFGLVMVIVGVVALGYLISR